MASSVSSERAFSSAGLTVTKRRNRLKGRLVEALQGLKCAIRNDLFLKPQGPTVEDDEGYSSDEDSEGEMLTAEDKRRKEKGKGPVIHVDLSNDEEDIVDGDAEEWVGES